MHETLWTRPAPLVTRILFLIPLLLTSGTFTEQATPPLRPAHPAAMFPVDAFPGHTDREKINHAFAAMRDTGGAKILTFSPREYLVTPLDLDTFEPVLGGTDLHDLVVEGNGATLVALDALDSQKGYFFKIRRFDNLTIRNLTLTYRPTPFVQGTILKADQPHNRTTLALDPAFHHLAQLQEGPHARFWCRVGTPGQPLHAKPGNPSWLDVGVDANRRVIAEPAGHGAVVIRAGGFSLADTRHGVHNWEAGDPIVIWKRAAQDGFCFEEGRNLRLENIRVESALHYALKLRGIQDAVLTGCRVEPARGAMLSSSADGIDVQQSRDIVIEHCTLIATGDDAISFLNHGHGDNGLAFEQKFPPPYPETNEGVLLRDNLIEGGNRNGILLLASRAAVLGNTLRHIRQYGLKFAGDQTRIESNTFQSVGSFAAYRHIQDELNTGILCSDEWIQSNVSIRHNTIADWFNMPGLLLKSVHQARVEHNTFILPDPTACTRKPFNPHLDQMKAISLTEGVMGASHFAGQDILIQNNRIQSRGGWNTPEQAIHVHGHHERVTLQDNHLERIETADFGAPGCGTSTTVPAAPDSCLGH